VVVVLITATWRPWADGAADRATSSGLIPVLTLIIGQLVSYAIAATSQSQALSVRRLELDREDERAERERGQREQAGALIERQERADRDRELLLAAVQATSRLNNALASQVLLSRTATMPAELMSTARVALLSAQHLFDPDDQIDEEVAFLLRSALGSMEEVQAAESYDDLLGRSKTLMATLSDLERQIARQGRLSPRH
jgi:hypothetical protein